MKKPKIKSFNKHIQINSKNECFTTKNLIFIILEVRILNIVYFILAFIHKILHIVERRVKVWKTIRKIPLMICKSLKRLKKLNY